MYNYGKGDLAKVGGFSTVPTTISGTAGTALSSTVTADFPNALYYAHNLPSGLSINSLPEKSLELHGGRKPCNYVLATGGTNECSQESICQHYLLRPSSAPKFGTRVRPMCLHHLPCSLVKLSSLGAHSNTVDFVWDTSDKGTSNISDWNGSALAVGTGKEGFYGKQVSDLSINTTYYYRNRATMALDPWI